MSFEVFYEHLKNKNYEKAKNHCKNIKDPSIFKQIVRDPNNGLTNGTSFLFWAVAFRDWGSVDVLIQRGGATYATMNNIAKHETILLRTVAKMMCRTEEGVARLCDNDKLARLIDAEHLYSPSEEKLTDESMATTLANTTKGVGLLIRMHKEFDKKIPQACFEQVITRGELEGASLALMLAARDLDTNHFFYELLASGYKLTHACIWSLIKAQTNRNLCLAYRLACDKVGRQKLLESLLLLSRMQRPDPALTPDQAAMTANSLNALINHSNQGSEYEKNDSVVRRLLVVAMHENDSIGLLILYVLSILGVFVNFKCLNEPNQIGIAPAHYLCMLSEEKFVVPNSDISVTLQGIDLLLIYYDKGIYITKDILCKKVLHKEQNFRGGFWCAYHCKRGHLYLAKLMDLDRDIHLDEETLNEANNHRKLIGYTAGYGLVTTDLGRHIIIRLAEKNVFLRAAVNEVSEGDAGLTLGGGLLGKPTAKGDDILRYEHYAVARQIDPSKLMPIPEAAPGSADYKSRQETQKMLRDARPRLCIYFTEIFLEDLRKPVDEGEQLAQTKLQVEQRSDQLLKKQLLQINALPVGAAAEEDKELCLAVGYALRMSRAL